MNRKNTIYAFVLISVMLVLGAKSLIYNLTPLFDNIDKSIAEGHTVVMNGKIDSRVLEDILIDGDYISDDKDAKFISEWYKKKIEEGKSLENLGAINTNRFKIPADTIRMYGGNELNSRLDNELLELGQDEQWGKIEISSLTSHFDTPSSTNELIKVYVGEKPEEKLLGIIPKSTRDVEGVSVRITEHWINDTIPSTNLSVSHGSKVLGYAKTDKNGYAYFYVPKGKFYSVLPIASGFQYGQEKGTVDGPLIKELETQRFYQTSHKLKPFSSSVYNQLKKDKALISRTPSEFINSVYSDIAIFILCWLAVFVITAFIDRKHERKTDCWILISLMALCGIGLLTLYGQMMPLSDIFYGHKMMDVSSLSLNNFSGGIVVGCALLILLSCVDYLRFYQKSSYFWAKKRIRNNYLSSILPTLPFIIFAIVLMVLLRFLGTSPEGSDAKVNLFGFQPSEIIKYFIVFFLAFFFVAKGDVIKTYGERMTFLARRRYFIVIGGVLLAIAIISLLFLALLKDMGPGIVILATFILLYSVVRRDTPQLILGLISYIVIVGGAYIFFTNEKIRIIAVFLWFVLWIWYNWKRYKTVFESALFLNALISMFLIGGVLIRPISNAMADRLMNRTNMAWSGIFDNAIPQGDQIAQGLWGTASGGFGGMGIGGGSAHFIPAGHTDLILNSLGEQMGWLGIVIVAVCFYILISRTTIAAQYSGHKFTFYLCLGLGLLMGVQFMFIALGSVGAIPLSGVPVPFLSYSGTSMVMALAAYGVVISISRHRGSKEALRSFVFNDRKEKDDIENIEAKSLNKNIFAGMVIFFIGIICIVAFNGYYQLINSAKTQIRPAITSKSDGHRILEYNPRIAQIMDMLARGNIYDRNGNLLATSNKNEIQAIIESCDTLGLDIDKLLSLQAKRLRRYYPFAENSVFIVGDINRPDVYSNFGKVPIGYFAESQEADKLKGFESHSQRIDIISNEYKFNRFLNTVRDTMSFMTYDYSALLPALSTSIYRNPWIEQFNASREKRDVYLTMDAVLQTKLQHKMAEYIKATPKLSNLKDLRASVVILDAKNGELLTSSNYPLPNTDSIINLRSLDLDKKSGAPSEWRRGHPITERDLGLTYQTAPGSTAKVMSAIAGFKKLGDEAFNLGYEIKPYMTVEPPSREPNTSMTSMNRNVGRKTFVENAIKYSSNCYFVMLLNEENLYPQFGEVYWTVGASLANIRPYFFSNEEYTEKNKAKFDAKVKEFQSRGLKDYNRYINQEPLTLTWNPNSRRDRMSSIQEYTGIAWGQSQLEASPLNMARVAGIIANDGVMQPTKFVLNEPNQEGVRVINESSAKILASAMNEEASKWTNRNIIPKSLNGAIGGKTGTPMRTIRGNQIMNDGWYICFIKDDKRDRLLSIAVRLERLPHGIVSTEAVRFMSETVLPLLHECGYLD